MFYAYRQNNSGGSFHFDKNDGITHFVIVEADSAKEANKLAKKIGLYWNGCEKGLDCSCCGDRWGKAWDDEGTNKPELYGLSVADFIAEEDYLWMESGYNVVIHHKDGRKVWY